MAYRTKKIRVFEGKGQDKKLVFDSEQNKRNLLAEARKGKRSFSSALIESRKANLGKTQAQFLKEQQQKASEQAKSQAQKLVEQQGRLKGLKGEQLRRFVREGFESARKVREEVAKGGIKVSYTKEKVVPHTQLRRMEAFSDFDDGRINSSELKTKLIRIEKDEAIRKLAGLPDKKIKVIEETTSTSTSLQAPRVARETKVTKTLTPSQKVNGKQTKTPTKDATVREEQQVQAQILKRLQDQTETALTKVDSVEVVQQRPDDAFVRAVSRRVAKNMVEAWYTTIPTGKLLGASYVALIRNTVIDTKNTLRQLKEAKAVTTKGLETLLTVTYNVKTKQGRANLTGDIVTLAILNKLGASVRLTKQLGGKIVRELKKSPQSVFESLLKNSIQASKKLKANKKNLVSERKKATKLIQDLRNLKSDSSTVKNQITLFSKKVKSIDVKIAKNEKKIDSQLNTLTKRKSKLTKTKQKEVDKQNKELKKEQNRIKKENDAFLRQLSTVLREARKKRKGKPKKGKPETTTKKLLKKKQLQKKERKVKKLKKESVSKQLTKKQRKEKRQEIKRRLREIEALKNPLVLPKAGRSPKQPKRILKRKGKVKKPSKKAKSPPKRKKLSTTELIKQYEKRINELKTQKILSKSKTEINTINQKLRSLKSIVKGLKGEKARGKPKEIIISKKAKSPPKRRLTKFIPTKKQKITLKTESGAFLVEVFKNKKGASMLLPQSKFKIKPKVIKPSKPKTANALKNRELAFKRQAQFIKEGKALQQYFNSVSTPLVLSEQSLSNLALKERLIQEINKAKNKLKQEKPNLKFEEITKPKIKTTQRIAQATAIAQRQRQKQALKPITKVLTKTKKKTPKKPVKKKVVKKPVRKRRVIIKPTKRVVSKPTKRKLITKKEKKKKVPKRPKGTLHLLKRKKKKKSILKKTPTIKKTKSKYAPSIVAIVEGITGKRPKRITGLELRPLPEKTKRSLFARCKAGDKSACKLLIQKKKTKGIKRKK